MLQDLDDETLRKIFNMPPPLEADNLRRADESEQAVDVPPPLTKDNPRRDRREPVVRRPSYLTVEDRPERCDDERKQVGLV